MRRVSKGIVFFFLLLSLGCGLIAPKPEPKVHSPRRAALDQREASKAEPEPAARRKLSDEPTFSDEPLPSQATQPTPAEVPTPEVAVIPTPDKPDAGAAVAPFSRPTPQAMAKSVESESVLALIRKDTAPQTAAALRLIEEGRGLLASKQVDAAQERFERAVAIDPTNVQGYYFLAKAHYMTARYDQADGFISRAAGLSMRSDATWQARVAALQGEIFEAVGRYPQARDAYRRAVHTDPQNVAAQDGLSRLHAQ